MKCFPTGLSCLFALVCLVGSGCSLSHSIGDDLQSTNPAIVLQAQKVVDLQQQVDAQEKVYRDQKDAVEDRERAVDKQIDEAKVEKKRLKALLNQLNGARQNLKGVRTQAETQ